MIVRTNISWLNLKWISLQKSPVRKVAGFVVKSELVAFSVKRDPWVHLSANVRHGRWSATKGNREAPIACDENGYFGNRVVIAERLGVTLNMSVLGQKKLFPWDKVISRYRSADLSLSEKHFFCACTATNGSIFPLVILRYKNSYTAMFSKMPVRDTFWWS